MKLTKRAVKAQSEKGQVQKAEALALKYIEQEGRLKAAQTALNSTKEEIKAFAKAKGSLEKKSIIVRGKTFAVGYTDMPPVKKISVELAAKKFPAKVFSKCTYTVTCIDEAELAQMIEHKKISSSLVDNCRVTSRAGHVRFLLTPIADLDAYLLKAAQTEGE